MMEDWEFDALLEWEELEAREFMLYEAAATLADLVFLSDNAYTPIDGENYSLGYLMTQDWWPLVSHLDEMVDLESVIELLESLDDLLNLPGVPSELLEAPLAFLLSVLNGDLPHTAAGRRVGSPKLVKIAQTVALLLRDFPDTAQAAVRAWADVHRYRPVTLGVDEDFEDLGDLMSATDLPPALSGFSMVIGLTLMQWPQRAEGLPLPLGYMDPELYDDVLLEWEALPDSPAVAEEGTGGAEALFAQGQLAHTLAQMGAVEFMAGDEDIEHDDEDLALAYSRLSRAALWLHDQCRHCPEREGVGCKVAENWPERPVPLLDVVTEVANTGRIDGCIKM
jgi:hypothetical protein